VNSEHSDLTAKKTQCLHYKDQLVNKEIITVFSENYTEAINTLCGQSAELLNVKALGFKGLSIIR
jgi:hypothetical protein